MCVQLFATYHCRAHSPLLYRGLYALALGWQRVGVSSLPRLGSPCRTPLYKGIALGAESRLETVFAGHFNGKALKAIRFQQVCFWIEKSSWEKRGQNRRRRKKQPVPERFKGITYTHDEGYGVPECYSSPYPRLVLRESLLWGVGPRTLAKSDWELVHKTDPEYVKKPLA